MTEPNIPTDAIGIMVHFLEPLTIHESLTPGATARVVGYGDVVVLTDELVTANRDRNGRCALLELLDDEPAQIARWGEVRVQRGPWPTGVPKIKPGSYGWDAARDRARAHALTLSEEEQPAALAAVTAEFGLPDEARSRTLARYSTAR